MYAYTCTTQSVKSKYRTDWCLCMNRTVICIIIMYFYKHVHYAHKKCPNMTVRLKSCEFIWNVKNGLMQLYFKYRKKYDSYQSNMLKHIL